MDITAYDGNHWRVDRLHKAARIARLILGNSEEQLGALVKGMHDHKGELVVTWQHKHTPQQELAFQAAWRECGENIVHHAIDGEF